MSQSLQSSSHPILGILNKKAIYLGLPSSILILHILLVSDFAIDDAWISFRYARNLVEGFGLVFNPGELVEGYTNFLWVIVIAAGIRFGLDPVIESKVLGTVLALATLLLTSHLFSVLTKQKTPNWFKLVPCTLLALNICFAAYAASGMETLLFIFLLVAGTAVYLRPVSSINLFLAGLVFALSALTRPEGLAFFAVTLFHLLVLRGGQCRLRSVVSFSLGFLLLFVPYFAWRYNYYGELFPNTFYAKVGGGIAIAQWLRGATYVLRYLSWFYGGALAFLFAVVYLLVQRRLTKDILYILVCVFVYMGYLIYVGGDGQPLFRFAVHLAPFLALLIAVALYEVIVDPPKWLLSAFPVVSKPGMRMMLVPLVLLMPLAPWLHYKNMSDGSAQLINAFYNESKWLKANAKPNDVLALPVVGVIPYYTGLFTIDMLGLTDAHIARVTIPTMGQYSLAGHEKFDAEYVFSRRPTYIWVSTSDEVLWIPGTKEIVALPGFLDYYEPVVVNSEYGRISFYRLRNRS